MRRYKLSLFFILTLLAGSTMVRSASAQDEVTVKPGQIAVAGTRGNVAVRQILLSSAAPLAGLRLIPEDLPRTDLAAVLPAAAIQPDLAAAASASDGVLAIPIQFDLRGVPSGEFNGNLLIVYEGGNLNLPLTVKVKDAWLLPLLVLLVGIALGVGVSTYRAQVRPRDEILVRVSQLRAQMRGDPDLPAPFKSRIETALVDVEAALQAENWEAARGAIEWAEAIWLKWRRSSDDWLAQLAYQDQLKRSLQAEGMDSDGNYEAEVRQNLDDLFRMTPDFDSPDQLRERLRELSEQINDLIQLRNLEAQFYELTTTMPETGEDYQTWQRKSWDFARQMHDLVPAERESLKAGLQEAIAELTDLLAQGPASTKDLDPEVAFSVSSRGLVERVGAALKRVAAPPTVRASVEEMQFAVARSRLAIFTALGYVIMVIALAGAGFGELYVNKTTFGANAWADYFALLGWGFGAEATRVSVTEMLRGLGDRQQKE